MSKEKGFTIIELIVVIAVVGILSTIVLTTLISVKNRGKDAAIKTSMDGFSKLALKYFMSHGNYGAMFSRNNDDLDAKEVQRLYDNLPAFLDCKTCDYKSDGEGWVVCAVLNHPIDQSRAWCVDSTGIGKEICANQCRTSGLASGACPEIMPACLAPTGHDSCSGCGEIN